MHSSILGAALDTSHPPACPSVPQAGRPHGTSWLMEGLRKPWTERRTNRPSKALDVQLAELESPQALHTGEHDAHAYASWQPNFWSPTPVKRRWPASYMLMQEERHWKVAFKTVLKMPVEEFYFFWRTRAAGFPEVSTYIAEAPTLSSALM